MNNFSNLKIEYVGDGSWGKDSRAGAGVALQLSIKAAFSKIQPIQHTNECILQFTQGTAPYAEFLALKAAMQDIIDRGYYKNAKNLHFVFYTDAQRSVLPWARRAYRKYVKKDHRIYHIVDKYKKDTYHDKIDRFFYHIYGWTGHRPMTDHEQQIWGSCRLKFDVRVVTEEMKQTLHNECHRLANQYRKQIENR